MKYLIYFLFLPGLIACNSIPEDHDLIYHYSVLKALDNGVLEGNMTVGNLLQQGDHGLGTFNGLNGEMVVLDRQVFRVAPEGNVVKAGEDLLIPYSVVSFFKPEQTFTIEGNGTLTYDDLASMMDTLLPSRNHFYAFRISGEFDKIICGGANMQEKPYDKSLVEILASRPIYKMENIHGTLIGFWCPAYIGDINTQGFHLHFLADDLSMGGHLIAFETKALEIQYDIKSEYMIVLPGSKEFKHSRFRDAPVNY